MNEGESVYYKTEGFVEFEVDIDHDDVIKAIEEFVWANTDFDFDECVIHNDRPFDHTRPKVADAQQAD